MRTTFTWHYRIENGWDLSNRKDDSVLSWDGVRPDSSTLHLPEGELSDTFVQNEKERPTWASQEP